MIEIRPGKIGPIATEWYQPKECRSSVTKLELRDLTIAHFGESVVGITRKLAAGSSLSKEETEQLNQHFFSSTKEIYSLPDWTHPQSFYIDRRDAAIAGIQYFGQLVPELAESFELRGEIAFLSSRPSDLLRYLAGIEGEKKGQVNRTLAFEAQRQGVLHHQLGIVESRALNAGLSDLLFDVLNLLNKKLFDGADGQGEAVPLRSLHDDETNHVVGFGDFSKEMPLTAHLKQQNIIVRRVPGIGLVHKKDREKELGPTIVKGWQKAINNGGTVHIDDALQDSIGMRFVIMDDAVPPSQFADHVISVIKAGVEEAGSDGNSIPQIAEVENDDETNHDHGQARATNFNARRKIWFDGVTTPMELIFYNREAFINSELEVGTRDSKTGLYLGRAHKLFELRRARDVVRVAFPKEIYGIEDHELNAAFVSRSKQIAYERRNMYRAS